MTVGIAFTTESCLCTNYGAGPAALEALLLLALDDTEFVAGGLSAASSVQAMRYWLHGHNELPVYVPRCITGLVAAARCFWSRRQYVFENS